jgi:hypothetical protein
MSAYQIELAAVRQELEDVLDSLGNLDGITVLLTAPSDRTRRQAASDRAAVTKELLHLGHRLDKARVGVLDQYHAIVMGAKEANAPANAREVS